MSGFPLRHRGTHVPDFVRQLEAVGPSDRRAYRQSLLSLHSSGVSPLPGVAADLPLATALANLAVWIDAAVRSSSYHAGPAKVRLHLAFLKVIVDELVPDERLRFCIQQLEAYVSYLATPPEPTSPPAARNMASQKGKRHPSYISVKLPPAPRHQPMGALLSPRVLQQIRRQEPGAATTPRPPASARPSGTLIELSDHEVAVLELALYFDEALQQLLEGSNASSPRARGDAVLTDQWLQMSGGDRKRALRRVRHKLAKHKFFLSNETAEPSNPSTPKSGKRRQISPDDRRSVLALRARLEPSKYFALVLLCLHETLRRVNVFSQELAQFAWRVLCDETVAAFEHALMAAGTQRDAARDRLDQVREAKSAMQAATREIESEIQRLQMHNSKSVRVWYQEQGEAEHLEREEQWHGHCKALVLACLAQLRTEANVPTWRQLGVRPREGPINSKERGCTLPYEWLPPGSALFDGRLRFQLLYVAHLVTLCRSYLHLHERQAVRDVLAPATPPLLPGEPQTTLNSQSFGLDEEGDDVEASGSHLIERISRRELETLQELSETLRAVEVVYAATTGIRLQSSAGGSHGDNSQRSRRLQLTLRRDAQTQFPLPAGSDTGSSGARAFLRSLAYCTVAATGFTGASAFLPAGASASVPDSENDSALDVGSGRRRASITFRARRPVLPQTAGSQPQQQPMIRLGRAMQKLPKHVKDLLLSPLLHDDPFPTASSVVSSLPRDELVSRIHSIYDQVVNTGARNNVSPPSLSWTLTAQPPPPPLGITLVGQNGQPTESPEGLVRMIYALYLDTAAGDPAAADREFVRFFASIQLSLSKAPSSSTPPEAAAHETIHFFAILTKLYHLQSPDGSRRALTPRLVTVAFSCQRVLAPVSLAKKRLQGSGVAFDVWVLASSRAKESVLAISPPFVLLESAKLLLLFVAGPPLAPASGSTTDETDVLDKYSQLLDSQSVVGTVSLANPTTPAAYSLVGTGAGATAGPNGRLTEAMVLPLQVAVALIARAWLARADELEQDLSVALHAALSASEGRLPFHEFVHVMTNGSPQTLGPRASVGAGLTSCRLAQLFAAAASGDTASDLRGARWEALLRVVVDELDLSDTIERLANADMRTIQLTLTASGDPLTAAASARHLALPWLVRAPYRGGGSSTAPALLKAWSGNSAAAHERFVAAMQTDNAVDGVHCWQTGRRRARLVDDLLAPLKPPADAATETIPGRRNVIESAVEPATSAISSVEMPDQVQVSVMWTAYYHLQLENARAMQLIETLRTRPTLGQHEHQLHVQTPRQTRTAAASAGGGLASPSRPLQSAKTDEVRVQQPLSPR